MTPAVTSATPASIRSRPSSSRAAEQLGHVQRVAGRRPQPRAQPCTGGGPGERAGQRVHVDFVERTEPDDARPSPSRTRSTSRSSAGGRGDGRSDPMTLNRETPARRAIAATTPSDRSSAQCRSSTASSTGRVAANSSTRSTLASIDRVAEVLATRRPARPAVEQLVQSRPGRPARACARRAARARRHRAGAPARRPSPRRRRSRPGGARRRRLPHEMGLADPGLTLDQQHPAHTRRRRRHQLADATPARRPARPSTRPAARRCCPRPPTAASVPRTPATGSVPDRRKRTAGAVPTSWRTTSDTNTSPPSARAAMRAAALTALPSGSASTSDHLAGVDPEPHPRRRTRQRPLRRQRERHRLAGRRERQQEPVTRRLHHPPAVGPRRARAPHRADGGPTPAPPRRRPAISSAVEPSTSTNTTVVNAQELGRSATTRRYALTHPHIGARFRGRFDPCSSPS